MDRFTLGFLKNQSGNNVIINNAMNKPLFQLSGDGKSEQVVTTGANLFENKYETQTKNGITLTKNEDGTITLNGTCSSSETYNDFNLIDLFSYSGEKIASVEVISGSATGLTEWQLTDNNWGNVLFMGIQNNINPNSRQFAEGITYTRSTLRVANNCVCNNLKFGLQIQNGTEVKPYEPYTGGQPSPSPDYEQPINSIEGSLEFADRGKNLFDCKGENQSINGRNVSIDSVNQIITVDGIGTNGNSYYFRNNFSNFKPGVYTITIERISGSFTEYTQGSNWAFLLYPFGSKLANLALTTNNMDKAQKTITITSDNIANVKESSLWFGWGPDSVSGKNGVFDNLKFRIQIEKGTQATEYEPYVEPNEVTFNLNDEKLRSVGDVKDELVVDLSTGDYYKLKNIENLELAISNMNDASEDYPGWLNVPNIQDYFPNVNATINTLAEFKSNITTNGLSIGINTINQSNLWLEKGEFNLIQTQWKEQYPDLVFKLDYSIPSTETIKLGTLSAEDLAKLKTFKGYNNVTVNTNLGLMNINLIYSSHTN